MSSSLPPNSIPSPEGPYVLQPHLFPSTYLPPAPAPLSSPVAISGMAFASAPGVAMYPTSPPPMAFAGGAVSSGLASSANALTAANVGVGGPGPLPGTSGGQIGSNGVPQVLPPIWPIKVSYTIMTLPVRTATEGKSGLGGLLGLGGGGKEDRPSTANSAANSSNNSGGGLGSGYNRERERTNSASGGNDYEPSVQSSDNNSNPQEGGMQDYSASASTTGGGGLGKMVGIEGGKTMGGRNSKGKEPPRPKNNLRSTSSTFITRVHTHDNFSKLITSPPPYDPLLPSSSTNIPPNNTTTTSYQMKYLFINTFKHLTWCLVDPSGKTKDPLMRITFSSPISAHTICEATKVAPIEAGRGGSDGRLDIIVGFASGDLIWLDPLVGKYTRLNKQGIYHSSPVTHIRHHPYNPSIIYVLHADGLQFTYSTDREDINSNSNSMSSPWSIGLKQWNLKQSSLTSEEAMMGGIDAEREREISKAKDADRMYVWKNEDMNAKEGGGNGLGIGMGMSISLGTGGGDKRDKEEKDKIRGASAVYSGKNPMAVWKVGSRGVKQFEFSPDAQVMAAVSEDGTLKIIDAANESILDTYAGYFGGLTCVTWSPDGRFVLAGGQDDLITIISPRESRVVARCQGHSSFVSSLAFDRRRSNARGYRFGSVGEDGRVILWDFSSASLQHRPRYAHGGTSQRRASIVSMHSMSRRAGSAGNLNADAMEDSPFGLRYHPAPLRSDVAMIQPVSVCLTEPTVLSNITFFTDSVATLSRMGHIRFWSRPVEKGRAPERRPGNAAANDPNAGVKDVKDRVRGMSISGRDGRKAVKV